MSSSTNNQTNHSKNLKEMVNLHENIDCIDDDEKKHSKFTTKFILPLKTFLQSLSFSTFVGIGLACLTVLGTVIGVPILYSFKTEETTTGSGILLRWNSKARTVAGITGESGKTADRLLKPLGLRFLAPDTLYISDYQNNRIQKWQLGASNGTTVAGQEDASIGTDESHFHYPASVVIDSFGNIYVSDRYNCRVQLWTINSTSAVTVAGTGVAGVRNDELDNPWGLSLDPNATTLYISDCYNNRIMKYKIGEKIGTLVAGGTGQGKRTTQLFFPTGLYYDATSNSLVIANWGGSNIVRWTIGDDHWTILAGSPIGETGTTSSLLNGPYDMVFDSMGNLYVADTGNHRVQLFLAGEYNGTTIAGSTERYGTTPSLLNYPYSIALDEQLNLYVADTFNDRVQRFSRY